MAADSISGGGGWASTLSAIITPQAWTSTGTQLLSNPPSVSTVLAMGATAVAGYCLYEQLKFTWWRRQKNGDALPGPGLATPVVGGILEMVKDPYGFWERQRQYSFPGLSWQSIVGKFTIFITDPAISRHVFNHNGKDSFLLALHPVARSVLGERNIAFLHGPEHKELRKSFLALFTRKALATYVSKQDAIICERLRMWLDEQGATATQWGSPTEMRTYIRDLNAWTSQEVFVGPYFDCQVAREKFSDAYRKLTEAFLAIPIMFPGTAVWAGYRARCYICKVLSGFAARSKARMAAGEEPECLLDFWSQQVNMEVSEAKARGVPPPFYSEDDKMAEVMMDFLFASQDASTASLVWTVTQLAEHPDVLEKVRAEQQALRPDLEAPITGEQINNMVYTRQVMKEILRFRPPAPMVPQLAQADFKLSDNYVAPKGALVVPSVWSACMQGYENPDKFDPDRFGPDRQEDVKFASNFLVFGHGPHYCVGKEYAQNHLTTFLCRVASSVDFQRIRSKESDDIKYLPTIYPGDSVFTFKWRNAQSRNCGIHA